MTTKEDFEEYNKVLEENMEKMKGVIENFSTSLSKKPTLKQKIKFYAFCWLPVTRYAHTRTRLQISGLALDVLKLNQALMKVTSHVNKISYQNFSNNTIEEKEEKEGKQQGGMYQ